MALKTCPECSGQVSETASSCPHCGYVPKKNDVSITKVGCWAVALILLIPCVVTISKVSDPSTASSSGESRDTEEEEPAKPPSYTSSARTYCKEFVKQKLKSPNSASFESTFPTHTDIANDLYEWNSHVDAQNSFGAEIRTNFFCKVKCTGSGECSPVDVRLESR